MTKIFVIPLLKIYIRSVYVLGQTIVTPFFILATAFTYNFCGNYIMFYNAFFCFYLYYTSGTFILFAFLKNPSILKKAENCLGKTFIHNNVTNSTPGARALIAAVAAVATVSGCNGIEIIREEQRERHRTQRSVQLAEVSKNAYEHHDIEGGKRATAAQTGVLAQETEKVKSTTLPDGSSIDERQTPVGNSKK